MEPILIASIVCLAAGFAGVVVGEVRVRKARKIAAETEETAKRALRAVSQSLLNQILGMPGIEVVQLPCDCPNCEEARRIAYAEKQAKRDDS